MIINVKLIDACFEKSLSFNLFLLIIYFVARVAELVYAHDLKSCLARDVGSIPTSGTGIFENQIFIYASYAPIAVLVGRKIR